MISDVDQALRDLIKDGLTVESQMVDICYDLPTRDWASRLNRPTIDLFLFDIRENLRLRGAEQHRSVYRSDNTVEIYRNPVRMDLRYLLTAWTKEPEDEHLLLSDALMTLLSNSQIPEKFMRDSLRVQDFPVLIDAANYQPENGPTEKVTDIWGVIDNDIHAGFIVTVTITVDPFKPTILPAVRSVNRDLAQKNPNNPDLLADRDARKRYFAGCVIRTDRYDASLLQVNLTEQNVMLKPDADYHVKLPPLTEGTYHLDVRCNGKVLKRQQIRIPSDNIEIEL